jgi:hypothetical protein
MPETLTQFESPTNSQAGFSELANDPNVGLADMLTKAGFEGLSPADRLSLVEQASVEEYVATVDAIHHKVAPDHSHESHAEPVKIVDPKTGEVRSHTAQPADRLGIMEHALVAARQVAQKYHAEGGSIDDALQRCGNLDAFGVVLAHNYKNGNGRTARALGELVYNGFDSANQASVSELAALSANRPERGFRINSYVPTGEWGEGRADENPTGFLDAIAALDKPLDGVSYAAAARGAFTTPRM